MWVFLDSQSPIGPVLSSLRWSWCFFGQIDELSWRQREIVELQWSNEEKRVLTICQHISGYWKRPIMYVQTKAGGLRNRPAAANARNTKTTSCGKSDQILTNCENPFGRVLSNRKEADLNYANFLRQRNMKRNYENFFIATVKIVAVLA